MADIIGGPHDGGYTFSAVSGQIGVVLSLSPDRIDPEPGQAGSYYRWDDGVWRFAGFVGREANWELLFWSEPRRRVQQRAESVWGWIAYAMFGVEESDE